MRDELNRKKYPRMPWHDVHCALWGPPCRDIARHFIQRWNHAKVYKMMLFLLKYFFYYCLRPILHGESYHREPKLQMNMQFLYLYLTITWSFLITWEEAER